MKSSSLGPLIALSALAVAPSVALAEQPSTPPSVAASTPATATTPEPAPILTTPGATVDTSPQALDPQTAKADEQVKESRRRAARKGARDSQAERKDPKPGAQATDPSLINPALLNVQAVPNFFIEDFNIPPFLLPIYQAAGSEYGIRWEVLASINHVETDFGRNLNVSSAGALGWMQFMPATWDMYGVDANGDGEEDPFNPADAIFSAARYLKAAGGDTDLQKGIFAYNHAQWYVDQVIDGAKKIAAYPDSLISSLSALTEGLSPIDAPSSKVDYPGKVQKDKTKVQADQNAAKTVESKKGQNSIEITAPGGSSVVAVQDGIIEKVGHNARLGTFVRLRDNYGNRYTYAHLGEVQDKVPVPKPTKEDAAGHQHSDDEAPAKGKDVKPTTPATAGKPTTEPAAATTPPAATDEIAPAGTTPAPPTTTTPDPDSSSPAAIQRSRLAAKEIDDSVDQSSAETPRKIRYRARPAIQPANSAPTPVDPSAKRLFAHPTRPESYVAGGEEQLNPEPAVLDEAPVGELAEYFSVDYGLKAKDVNLRELKSGQAVIAGTILGKLVAAPEGETNSKLTFEIRPAGAKAPRIDPKPILDGWNALDKTNFYRAQAKKALETGEAHDKATVGQILLMGKAELQQRVLADKRISIYECGIRDIKAGQVDRRILALLEVLAVKGVGPSVTSMKCGHGTYTSSGNVSQHTTGTAVDIGTVYGTVISPATQGTGSVTDKAVREILGLQGNMKPDQIITLMKYQGEDNTLPMADHHDHIHVGYKPISGKGGSKLEQLLKANQWDNLVDQISSLDLPDVASAPSAYSTTVEEPDTTK